MFLKLQPGQDHIGTVKAVSRKEGNYGTEVIFDLTDGNAISYKADNAERQLARIGLDEGSCVGQTLKFYKTPKNGAQGGYLNIERPAGQGAPTPRSTAVTSNFGGYDDEGRDTILGGQAQHETQAVRAIQQGATHAERMGQMSRLYAECLNIAVNNVPAALGTLGIQPESKDIIAAAATLFIAAKDRGMAA